MSARDCIARVQAAAGRALTEAEVLKVFERVHQAALDIRAGRVQGGDVKMGGKLGKEVGAQGDLLIQEAAQRASADMEAEAALKEKQADLQVVKLGARLSDIDKLIAAGVAPIDAVEKTIVRDYTGRLDIESLEQKSTGYRDYFMRQLLPTWDALGKDFAGFFQDRAKVLDLIKELRGEDTGNAMAKKGAAAFHAVAEESRLLFNSLGGEVGKLDDWGMPQHHSQEKVATAGRDAWVDTIMPLLDRGRYRDAFDAPFTDDMMKEFLKEAWNTIATNGMNRLEPGTFTGNGKRAGRHAEERQIHFKDAESLIDYWNQFGDRTAVEIMTNHVETMARDVAFVEHFGPNPVTTYNTLRDTALLNVAQDVERAGVDTEQRVEKAQARAVNLDNLWAYANGSVKPTYRPWLRKTMDAISNLNVAGKLGGAVWASVFGDKPMMEAVSHLNDMPMMQRWGAEMRLLNPANGADRRLLQTQGLMLDSVRSGLQRFYEGLGQSSFTGRIANAVMRVSGMQAINDIRKGAFGLNAFAAIGDQISRGTDFANLHDTDVRLLKTWGITDADWKTWKLAQLNTVAGVEKVLTPEAIARIPDAELERAGVIGPDGDAAAARREAMVKLLGVVNTESEFAVITPGWKERAAFYGSSQRGTVPGELTRAFLQFKAFPFAAFKRGMDAVANADTATNKAVMTSYLIASTTLAGAMVQQVRQVLSGRDPMTMNDKNWWKFWGQSFLQGGAMGIYGDFLYGATQTRYGTGPLEALAGPTIGPFLETGVTLPLQTAKAMIEGRDTHFAARALGNLKGFIPGGNLWYTKAAMDHMVWQRTMEMLSPGYMATIRQNTLKQFNQQWWWEPGEATPDRSPDLGAMVR